MTNFTKYEKALEKELEDKKDREAEQRAIAALASRRRPGPRMGSKVSGPRRGSIRTT